MTAKTLARLIAAADLADRANRLILADAMEEAGRDEEAALLRGEAEAMLDAEDRVVVRTPLEEARKAFAEASGAWTGCGWDVYALPSGRIDYFGDEEGCLAITEDADGCEAQADGWQAVADLALDALDGLEGMEGGSAEARAAVAASLGLRDGRRLGDAYSAEECETLARQWRAGAEHLREIESDAEAAEEAGAEAMEHAEAGRWEQALDAAARACRIEQQYGDCPTWSRLRSAIRSIIEDLAEAGEAPEAE
ncbi:MAG TPA: hypothetical protein VEJ18_00725 [Planctomycetota bacterium]|nr:hypothetical protein [Planctomycetota bacterium]